MTEIRIQNYKSVSDTEVADAVLALAEPVLARCAGHFDLEKQFLTLAVTGWNLSLFPTTDEELSEAIAKRLPPTLVEDQRVVFTGFLRSIVKEKQERFPEWMRGITRHTISKEADQIRLEVKTLAVKPG